MRFHALFVTIPMNYEPARIIVLHSIWHGDSGRKGFFFLLCKQCSAIAAAAEEQQQQMLLLCSKVRIRLEHV